MKLDAYIRVSRVGGREGESFISPKVQRERITAYAKAHGHKIGQVFEELDASGGKADRPLFLEALARVERGESDGLIVAKIDRFSRSLLDALTAIKRVEEGGGKFISVADGFDTTTLTGQLVMKILLAISENELGRIRESWKSAQEHAVRRGVHVASRTPTGYVRGRDGRLELDPKAAPAIRDVFLQRAGGASWRDLSQLLDARKVKGPYGNAIWTTSAVSKVIANRVYMGEARSGQFSNVNAHPAIVSPTEWAAAQIARPAATTSADGGGALLAGLLRCAGCRFVLKSDHMRDGKGERIRIYRCRGEHSTGKCTAPSSALARVVEPYVVGQFFDAIGAGGVLARATPRTDDVDSLKATVAAAEAELAAWRDETSIVDLGRDIYVAGLEARAQRVDQAQAALQDALVVTGVDTLPAAAELRATWPELTTEEQRRILTAGVDAIMLRRGRDLPIEQRALVLWHGEGPADLPRRGRRVPVAAFPWPDDRPVDARLAVA